MATVPAIITVAHEELDGSPIEGYDENGFSAKRVIVCAWGERFTLADQLMGQSVITDASGTTVYIAPAKYPHKPTLAVASNCEIAPFAGKILPKNGDTTLSSYEKAQLTVSYKTTLYTTDGGGGSNPDPMIEESIEPFAEFLTLPHDGFKWGSTSGTPLKPQEAPGKLVRGLNWLYTRHRLVQIPSGTFSLVGYVNSAAITSRTLGWTFPVETLLYNPPRLFRAIVSVGNEEFMLAWTLGYSFTFKPDGWNKFWRAETSTFAEIYNASAVVKVYPTGAFSIL